MANLRLVLKRVSSVAILAALVSGCTAKLNAPQDPAAELLLTVEPSPTPSITPTVTPDLTPSASLLVFPATDLFKDVSEAEVEFQKCLTLKTAQAASACAAPIAQWAFYFGDRHFTNQEPGDGSSFEFLLALLDKVGPIDFLETHERAKSELNACLVKAHPFERYHCVRMALVWIQSVGAGQGFPQVSELIESFQAPLLAMGNEAEALCYEIDRKLMPECLDSVVNWWFKYGANYVDFSPYRSITRILKAQLLVDATAVERISNLAYMSFSIDSDRLVEKQISDFSDETLNAYLEREDKNLDNYSFYDVGTTSFFVIVSHKQFGSDATKTKYYDALVRFQNRAKEIWSKLDHSQMDPGAVAHIENQQKIMDRVIQRYSDPAKRSVKKPVTPPVVPSASEISGTISPN